MRTVRRSFTPVALRIRIASIIEIVEKPMSSIAFSAACTFVGLDTRTMSV
jgi:hypothetical protein